MAQLSHPLFKDLRGAIGKQLVFKQYGNKTVVTRYPDMSGVKPSEQQKEKRKLFAQAVDYARAISRNPQQKALYQQKITNGQSVYHYALKEYLTNHKQ